MTREISVWKRLLAVLCIFLILSYAAISLVPHAHHFKQHDCVLCEVIDISDEIMITLTLAAVLRLLRVLMLSLHKFTYIPSGREATPVGLKVKLSD